MYFKDDLIMLLRIPYRGRYIKSGNVLQGDCVYCGKHLPGRRKWGEFT